MKMHVDLHNNRKRKELGFTLVELIVVMAIIAVLVGVGAPMFMRTLRIRQADGCLQNREALMAIYERCLVEEWQSFEFSTLEKVCKGEYDKVKSEVVQYNRCTLNGSYSYAVVDNKAKISCTHADHTEVAELEWRGWGGTDPAESDDDPLTPPGASPVTPPVTPPATP